MRRSPIVTLFAEPPRSEWRPSASLISIAAHGIVLAFVFFGLRHLPPQKKLDSRRYTVRLLNLHAPEPALRWTPPPEPSQAVSPAPAVARASRGSSGQPAPSAAPQLRQVTPALQTLIQPDIPPDVVLQKPVPVPSVVLWTPGAIPVKTIVPLNPSRTATARAHPSLLAPNREPNPADLKIAASAFASKAPVLPPSTTTPIVVHAPAAPVRLPDSVAQTAEVPAPARVISLSETQVQKGTVAIPVANEAPLSSYAGPLGTGTSDSQNGDDGEGKAGARGSASGPAAGRGEGDQVASGGNPANTSGNGAPSPGNGNNAGETSSLTVVTAPKDGRFGVVVVGSTLAEKYPETVGIWSGRLAYTVYLRVGVKKSWILQYSLARGEAQGATAQPDAPWPYLMIRPHLAPGDFDSDALMVHGFVNADGRFEGLQVVFPEAFEQARFVLDALQQWQFRPARHNGQNQTVEILLIIPEEGE